MPKFIIEIRSKGFKQTKRRLDETTISLRKQHAQINRTTKGMNRFRLATSSASRVIGGIRNKILLLTFAVVGLTAIFRRFGQVTRAAKLEDITRGFDHLRINAGLSADTLDKLIDATDGTVTNMELMRLANNALLLGIAKSDDELASMFDSAQRLARALGKDARFGIESLVTGLGRQSRLMLDNIGIMLRVNQVYEDFAKELDITAEELTDAQRKTAFLEAGLDQAAKKAATLGKEVLSTSDQLQKTNRSFTELGDTISIYFEPVVLSMSRVLRQGAEDFNAYLKATDTYVQYKGLREKWTTLRAELDKLLFAQEEDIRVKKEQTDKEKDAAKAYEKRIKSLAAEFKLLTAKDRMEKEIIKAQLLRGETLTKVEEIIIKNIMAEEALIQSKKDQKETDEEAKEATEDRIKAQDKALKEQQKFEKEQHEERKALLEEMAEANKVIFADSVEFQIQQVQLQADHFRAMKMDEAAIAQWAEQAKTDAVIQHLEERNAAFSAFEAGYNQFINTLTDAEMTGGERREQIWEASKNAFIKFTGDLLLEWIKQQLAREVISKTGEAAAIASAGVTGALIAAEYAVPASLAATASFGAAAVTGTAAVTASVVATKALASFAQGGDFVTSGPQVIMVGDNPGGRERVQISPLSSSAGASGGGVTINIHGGVVSDDYIRNELIPALNKATGLGARINA